MFPVLNTPIPFKIMSEELILATQRGMAKSEVVVKENAGIIAHVLGDKFQVSELGLQLTEGEEPTEQEITEAVAFLAKNSEDLDRVKMSIVWNLGDLLKIARNMGILDAVLDQAIKTTGKSKHTCMQSLRLCDEFETGDRIQGFTATHHQELLNYRNNFEDKPKVLEQILEESFRGVGMEFVTKDGKELTLREPISVAQFRAKLQEGCGKVKKTPLQYGRTKFLYIRRDDPELVYRSEELNEGVLERGQFVVVSLEDMSFREEGNEVGNQIFALSPGAQ